MKDKKEAPRLVGRQFAKPLTEEEIDQVAGGLINAGVKPSSPGNRTFRDDED